MTDEMPSKEDGVPLHRFDSLPKESIDQLQLAMMKMLYPLLRLTRQPDRIGNGDISDMHKSLAKAELFVDDAMGHWLVADFSPLADSMSAQELAAPLMTGSAVTAKMARLVEFLIETGDSHRSPRRGPLHKGLIDLCLNEQLDERWPALFPRLDLLRVGTSVLAPCVDAGMANDVRCAMVEMLSAVVDEAAVCPLIKHVDLYKGDVAQWVGFDLRLDIESMKFKVSEEAWLQLELSLAQIRGPNQGVEASRTITEWVQWMAPGFGVAAVMEVHARLTNLLRENGLGIAPSPEMLRHVWHQAYGVWRHTRGRCRRQRRPEGLD